MTGDIYEFERYAIFDNQLVINGKDFLNKDISK